MSRRPPNGLRPGPWPSSHLQGARLPRVVAPWRLLGGWGLGEIGRACGALAARRSLSRASGGCVEVGQGAQGVRPDAGRRLPGGRAPAGLLVSAPRPEKRSRPRARTARRSSGRFARCVGVTAPARFVPAPVVPAPFGSHRVFMSREMDYGQASKVQPGKMGKSPEL